MGLISFSCAAPVASWSPSVNPKRWDGYVKEKRIFQPQGYAGTHFYSYDHGEKNLRTLGWDALPSADMTTLLVFLGLIEGGATLFSFTDYDTTVYTACRMLNFESFPFKHLNRDYYQASLEIEVA